MYLLERFEHADAFVAVGDEIGLMEDFSIDTVLSLKSSGLTSRFVVDFLVYKSKTGHY